MAATKKKDAEEALPFETALKASRTLGYLHSGNYALNYALTGRFSGGWPLGHVAEIFGPQGSGKSFLLLRALAEALRLKDGDALLDDTENAINIDWAQNSIGVDVSKLRQTNSDTVEEHSAAVTTYLEFLAKTKKTAVLGLDSIALLSTDEEAAAGFDKKISMAAVSKAVRKHFRLIKMSMRGVKVAYICTNHTIASFDMFNPNTTPTGTGLKFHAGIRVELKNPTKVKAPAGAGDYLGVIVTVFVEKNRFGRPWRKVKMAIPFDTPINPLSGLIPVLVDRGYLLVHAPEKKNSSICRLVFHDGSDTGVMTHEKDHLYQDASADELLTRYPDLLQKADEYFEAHEGHIMMTGGVDDDDAEDE